MDHLSQSGACAFRNCRKFAYLRYEHNLAPKAEDDTVLSLGKLIHKGLEVLLLSRKTGKKINVDAIVDAMKTEKPKDPHHVFVAVEAVKAYDKRWPDSEYEVYSVEDEFELPLLNPDTNSPSRTFYRTGKIDAIFRKKVDGTFWLVEHKSAGRVDAAYMRKLWLDFQIAWYVDAAQRFLGKPLAGVIYDILMKPATADLVPDKGETEGEFEERRSKLKNPKAGKRKMPETEAEFEARVVEFYTRPDAFVREEVLLKEEDIMTMLKEAWDIGQAWIDARAKNRWYRNTAFCFQWNKPCIFLPICQSYDNPLVIESGFTKRDSTAQTTKPAF
jgi:hypothetical protein